MTSSLPCFASHFNTRVPLKSKNNFRRYRRCHRFMSHDAFRLFYLVLRTPQVSVFLVKLWIFIAPFVVFYVNFLDILAPSTCILCLAIGTVNVLVHRPSHEKSHHSSTHKSPKRAKNVATETTKHNEDVLKQILQSVTELRANLSVCNSRFLL